MTRIKICGITNPNDAMAAIAAGADAIGVVCCADVPRKVEAAVVHEIASVVPPFVTMVLLFVDPGPTVVEQSLGEAPFAWLQFHGKEGAGFCESFGVPYIKACRPKASGDVEAMMEGHKKARSLLVDGGFGEGNKFDWSLVPARKKRKMPLIIAGGLGPGNVASAIKATDPDAVDVSSGVCTSGDPRRKDPAKISDFIGAARGANGRA